MNTKHHSHSPARLSRGAPRTGRSTAQVHGRNVLVLAFLAAGVSGSVVKVTQAPQRPALAQVGTPVAGPVVTAVAAQEAEPSLPAEIVVAAAEPAKLDPLAVASDAHDDFEQLRSRLRWVPVRVGGRELATPDADSRLLLVRSAAARAGLAEVGLDYRDVYGVINAETTWVARTGMGRNGVASYGLAQFEPATAKAVGVRDANDPVEAVHGAARLLKEAAVWSGLRIAGLGLGSEAHAARLREGVSIYYNLSSRARSRWNGLGSASLPVETQRHIRNVRVGAQQAERLQAGAGSIDVASLVSVAARDLKVASAPAPLRRDAAATAKPARAATPQPLGTIAWSGSGEDAAGRRAGGYVLWSNGAVTRDTEGRVRWSSALPKQRG